MESSFYIAQIFSLIAWFFLISSFWNNKTNKLLYLQIVSCCFFVISYIFLKAYTGIIVVIFEIIRDYFYLKSPDKKKVFLWCVPVYSIIGLCSFDGLWSLFSIFASLCDGYALMYKGKKVVIFGIVAYILWMIYDINFQSYVNVCAQIFLIISNMMILLKGRRILWHSDRLIVKKGVSLENLNSLYQIDQELYHEIFLWKKSDLAKGIKNKLIDYLVLKDETKSVGYVNFAVINKEKYKKILLSRDYEKVSYRDLKKFDNNQENYIYILNITIDYDYQNEVTMEIISQAIRDYLQCKINDLKKINGVVSIGILDNDREILENCGFEKHDNFKTNYHVYKLEGYNLDNFLERGK